jgi:hypothetical protein
MLDWVRCERRWHATPTTLQGRRSVYLLSCDDHITRLRTAVRKIHFGKYVDRQLRGGGM